MNGKINIVTPLVPYELRHLYTSQGPAAKYLITYGTSILISLLHLLVWSWTRDSAMEGLEFTPFMTNQSKQ
jgi:hypothetical protein